MFGFSAAVKGATLDIIVKTRNCDVPARLKEDARERLVHSTRFYDRLLGVELLFSADGNPRIPEPAHVEVTARTKGHHIRALGSGEDHRAAVDQALARFERQLRRYKARLIDRARQPRPEPASTTLLPSDAEDSSDEQARIVRRKRFEMRPMLPEEAALQLELLGHDFFLFANAASGLCSVVYRRRDGQIGLIEGVHGEDEDAPDRA